MFMGISIGVRSIRKRVLLSVLLRKRVIGLIGSNCSFFLVFFWCLILKFLLSFRVDDSSSVMIRKFDVVCVRVLLLVFSVNEKSSIVMMLKSMMEKSWVCLCYLMCRFFSRMC